MFLDILYLETVIIEAKFDLMMNLNEFDLFSFISCIENNCIGLFLEWVHLLEYIMICKILFISLSLSESLNEFIFLFLTIFQGIPVLTAATLASLTQQVQQQQQQQQQQVQQQQQPAAAAVLQQLQQLQNASTQPLQLSRTLHLSSH